jgi:hypothetical protein
MRKTLLALAASAMIAGVAFVGCGDDSGVMLTDMGKDGPTTGGPDMVVPKVGCNGFVTCINDCFTANPTSASLTGCEAMCSKTSKANAQMEFENALACGQGHCLGDLDAMNGKCKLLVSGSSGTLVNADGSMIMSSDPTTGTTGTKDCNVCLNDSLARLFGVTCVNMSSSDCNPTECKTVTDTCLNDMP